MKPQLNLKLVLLFIVIFTANSIFLISCQKDSILTHSFVPSASMDNSTSGDLKDKLVGWYTFNGNDSDHSSYQNNVDFNNAIPTEGKRGAANTAYYFDGFSSYMTIPNSQTLNPRKAITLAAFVKPTAFYQGKCHRNTILYKAFDDHTPGKYLLAYDDMAFYNYGGCDEPIKEKYQNFYGSFGDGQATAAGARDDSNYIHAGSWYAIIFTYDGRYAKLYINGVLKQSNAVTTTFSPNDFPIYIGKSPANSYPYWFTGVIDEIRIYARALTEDQIEQLTSVFQTGN